MKSYTDLEQSRKLAEILPIKSADMYYFRQIDIDYFPPNVESICPIPLFKNGKEDFNYDIPCWSLAALLDVLPDNVVIDGRRWSLFMNKKRISYLGHMTYDGQLHISVESDNFVNSCYEMILKLKERNLI